MSKEEIKNLLETIEDSIPVEEYRSVSTSDGLTHYKLDKESYQYKVLEYIKDLQQENQKLKENLMESMLNSYNQGCEYTKVVYKKQLKQRDEVIDEVIEYLNNLEQGIINGKIIGFNHFIPLFSQVKSTLNKYKGDNNE